MIYQAVRKCHRAKGRYLPRRGPGTGWLSPSGFANLGGVTGTTCIVDRSDPIPATFVSRPNRFLVRARLADRAVVEAHLPNTGRLTHLMIPGRPLILRPAANPARKTRFTVARAWDGCWVALEATQATERLAGWLKAGNPLPVFGAVTTVEREVRIDEHRIDLRVATSDGRRVWVEVKSGGRVVDGVALLSQTPSTRGAGHLAKLADLVRCGAPAAVAFVIQRPDARALRIGGDADPGWIDAVVRAAHSGVEVLAFGCDVTATAATLSGPLPVRWDNR